MKRLLSAAILIFALAIQACRAEPVTIRVGWVVVPFEVVPVLFGKREVLRHEGQSYRFEPVHYQGASTALVALASGDLDTIALTPLNVASAIENAKLDDLRAILDEYEDGVDGYYSNGFRVANNGPIKSIEDLKGRAVVTLAIGSSADLAIRAMLLTKGLVAGRDYADLEAAPQNMLAMLKDGKVDLIATAGLTTHDPALVAATHPLFSRRDALGGPSQEATFFARASFIAAHRSAMVDFLEDYLRSLRWFLDPANHAEAVARVAAFTKAPPGRFADWIFTHDDEYRAPDGIPDLVSLQRVLDLMQRLAIGPAVPQVARYADLSLVEEAAARLQ